MANGGVMIEALLLGFILGVILGFGAGVLLVARQTENHSAPTAPTAPIKPKYF